MRRPFAIPAAAFAVLEGLILYTAAAYAADKAAPDISTPKSAFDAFAGRAEDMIRIAKELQSLFKPRDTSVYASVITPAFADFLKKREERQAAMRGSDREGALAFDKEEVLEEDLVAVCATQKNSGTEVEIDPQSGARKEKVTEEVRRHRIIYRKSGGGWRIERWLKECRQCKGSALCPECGGEGKIKPRDCRRCKGTGKSDDGSACPLCEGTGKTQPSECFMCKKSGGKCVYCKGEGWSRQDRFEGSDMFMTPSWKVEAFSDLGTPENAAKTYFSLRDQNEVSQMEAVSKVVGIIKEMIETLFAAETAESFNKATAKSAEKFLADKASFKREFGAAENVEGVTVVTVTEKSKDRKGKERAMTRILKLVQADGKWLVDDRGNQCWSCGGSGLCPQCGGSCKTQDGKECYSCKETKGKCPQCKGGKIAWETSLGK